MRPAPATPGSAVGRKQSAETNHALVPMLLRRGGADDAPASACGVSADSVPPRWSVALAVPTLEHRDEWYLLFS